MVGNTGAIIVDENGLMNVKQLTSIVTTHFRDCDQLRGFAGSFGPSQVICSTRQHCVYMHIVFTLTMISCSNFSAVSTALKPGLYAVSSSSDHWWKSLSVLTSGLSSPSKENLGSSCESRAPSSSLTDGLPKIFCGKCILNECRELRVAIVQESIDEANIYLTAI